MAEDLNTEDMAEAGEVWVVMVAMVEVGEVWVVMVEVVETLEVEVATTTISKEVAEVLVEEAVVQEDQHIIHAHSKILF